MNIIFTLISAALILTQPDTCLASAAHAEGQFVRVQFTGGTTSVVIDGQLKGSHYIDYQVPAFAGQTLTVSLKSTNPQNHFNINPPDSDVSMYVGQKGGDFRCMLPDDGNYTVRVYSTKSNAHQNESSNFELSIGLFGAPITAIPPPLQAVLTGKPFHAYSLITCAPFLDQKVQTCGAFATLRGYNGTATIEVHSAVGINRRILFVAGKPVATDAQDSMTYSHRHRSTIIYFYNVEWYEIPNSLLYRNAEHN